MSILVGPPKLTSRAMLASQDALALQGLVRCSWGGRGARTYFPTSSYGRAFALRIHELVHTCTQNESHRIGGIKTRTIEESHQQERQPVQSGRTTCVRQIGQIGQMERTEQIGRACALFLPRSRPKSLCPTNKCMLSQQSSFLL